MSYIEFIREDGSKGRYPQSFDVGKLDWLLDVVGSNTRTMVDLAVNGHDRDRFSTVLRHDVDHSMEHALSFARFEQVNGIVSSYFILPTAGYWAHEHERTFEVMHELEEMGHEVGIHNDAASVVMYDHQPSVSMVLLEWLAEMRAAGFEVAGCAAHGGAGDNMAIWSEYEPKDFGLDYEAYLLQRQGCNYYTDNRGRMAEPEKVDVNLPTIMLVHPEHWSLP